MQLAPVALFVYRRASHAARVIDALRANLEAGQTDLHIFSDAAKSDQGEADVRAVRAMIAGVSGFRSVSIIERPRNLGLARSIISGVDELTRRFDAVIVLEDDLLPSAHFLAYTNAGLVRYAHEPRVASIHAYCYPVDEPLPETFFIKGADCWGWGTWRRAWELFEPDGRKLLAQIEERGLQHEFDFEDSYAYTRMLADAVAGKNDSWAVRWYASAFLRDMLTLYPGSSQVQNIGIDGSGQHVGATDIFTHARWGEPVNVSKIVPEQDMRARAAFARFFRSMRVPFMSRLARRLQRTLRSLPIGR